MASQEIKESKKSSDDCKQSTSNLSKSCSRTGRAWAALTIFGILVTLCATAVAIRLRSRGVITSTPTSKYSTYFQVVSHFFGGQKGEIKETEIGRSEMKMPLSSSIGWILSPTSCLKEIRRLLNTFEWANIGAHVTSPMSTMWMSSFAAKILSMSSKSAWFATLSFTILVGVVSIWICRKSPRTVTAESWKNGLEGVKQIRSTKQAHKDAKTFLFLGQTGSGITSSINSMINHIYGVDFEDKFRLKLVDDEPVESMIRTYHLPKLSFQRFPHPITVIDCPGFGMDYEGDSKLEKKIDRILKERRIDAIFFTMSGNQSRITINQRLILSMLAKQKGVSDKLFLLFTFCCGGKPPVANIIKGEKIKFAKAVKINNSGLQLQKVDDACERNPDTSTLSGAGDQLCKVFWRMNMNSFARIFLRLNRTSG
mmetsp:Transcript_1775/g.2450  ORF Transcript_1775/g.2450 Transcript_1775/m.2450 type:complete len:425 (+) Transcript_1775:63-1337(+)